MDSTPLLAAPYPRQPARTAHLQALRQWLHNTRTRRQLAELDSRQLADLGISPSERVAEISKPFWR